MSFWAPVFDAEFWGDKTHIDTELEVFITLLGHKLLCWATGANSKNHPESHEERRQHSFNGWQTPLGMPNNIPHHCQTDARKILLGTRAMHQVVLLETRASWGNKKGIMPTGGPVHLKWVTLCLLETKEKIRDGLLEELRSRSEQVSYKVEVVDITWRGHIDHISPFDNTTTELRTMCHNLPFRQAMASTEEQPERMLDHAAFTSILWWRITGISRISPGKDIICEELATSQPLRSVNLWGLELLLFRIRNTRWPSAPINASQLTGVCQCATM